MKNRIALTATTVAGALAVVTLTACSSSLGGHGSTSAANRSDTAAVSGAASAPAPSSSTGATGTGSHGSAGTGSTGSGSSGHGSTGHGSAGGHLSTAPGFTTASVNCEVTSYEDIPGQSHVPLYSPVVRWQVVHATGMALSVDNPGLVGSYGTYGPSGSLTLGGGCYIGDNPTTIEFYTVGGTGARAHHTVVLTGTHNHVTAPPFSSQTPSQTPSASPSQ
jgi:hypothetical protein